MSSDLQALIDTLTPQEQALARCLIEALVDFERANRPTRRKRKDRPIDAQSRAGLEKARRRFLRNVG